MSKELKRHSVRGVKYNGEEICGGFAYYDADDVDALLAEKDVAIAELKKKCEAEKSIGATFSENGAELARWVEELRKEIESLKASHYAEMVDAGMRERRVRRALWLARALRARDKAFEYHFKNNVEMCAKWDNIHLMLMAKAEEYK